MKDALRDGLYGNIKGNVLFYSLLHIYRNWCLGKYPTDKKLLKNFKFGISTSVELGLN